MVNRLAGCYVKLARAGAHLNDLRVGTERLFGIEPERIPGEFDAGSGDYVFRAQRSIVVPLEWSAIVGDVVHNLHAALDYLAWELVAANGQNGTGGTAFPIFTDRARYQSGAPRKIRGMHPDAQALMERLQPFQISPRDGHPSEHPLAILYELERRDKHRSLNLTAHVGDVTLLGLSESVHQGPGPSMFEIPYGSHEAGVVLTRARGFAAEPRLNLALSVTHRIVFDRDGPCPGEDVLKILAEIKRHIENVVVPPFRRFF